MSIPLNGTRYGWLASYPRSGNTWLRFLLASLIQGGGPIDINAPGIDVPIANPREFDELFCMDSSLLTDAEIEQVRPLLYGVIAQRFQGPLILRKVHDRCWRNAEGQPMFPPELSRGAVYIVRDPRDVAVSYAHYAGVDLDEMTRRMGDPALTIPTRREQAIQFSQPLGTWSGHVLSWLDGSGMPVHLMRYEDLSARPIEELTKVAIFLGVSPEKAEDAVAAVGFTALRGQEDESGFRELAGAGARFFRQGTAGGWRSVLSAAQVERVERDHGAVMARLGYL
jgi:aryl sulfotransferase